MDKDPAVMLTGRATADPARAPVYALDIENLPDGQADPAGRELLAAVIRPSPRSSTPPTADKTLKPPTGHDNKSILT